MAGIIPLGNVGRSAIRMAKNYTKGYSDIQTKTRAATSNDPWGPSGSQMNELAQATFNQQDFIEIMEMLDKRLNDKGKNWRHVFKSLTLLDYMIHAGSENVVLYFQENIYIIKTLREFVYVDDDGKDQGANVRQKAKELTALLMDDARIRDQRKTRSNMRDRMSGYPTQESRGDSDSDDDEARRNRNNRKQNRTAEDSDLQRALEESKRMAAQEADRAKRNQQAESDLEKAIRLSREEDENRKRQLAGNNGSLFDPDAPNNNSSAWDSLIDMNDNPPQQAQMQMPMITGFPTTQFQSFNPYYQQQQEEMMRQQRLMEMQRQMAEQEAYNQMLQQQALQQQQQQQQAMMYQQQMALQQQQPSPQPLVPQHTAIGSNNPFAAFSQPASPPPMPTQQPPPLVQRPASTPAQPKPPKDDGKYAHLAGLLGNRDDGVDTFGNQGQLRYGHASGRIIGQPTGGTNPFQRQQQSQQQQPQQQNNLLLDL